MRSSFLLIIVVLAGFLFSECRRDRILNDPNADLSFSQDTVLFDTVFTTVNTVTKEFKVYNEHDRPVKVERIDLAGGEGSDYRINVNGRSGDHHQNIEIPGNDSIFIFVEARIDPTNTNDPMVVTDSILFMTNGNEQQVKLAAWGQDAYFHHNVLFGCNSGDIVWPNDKPHVVYGTAAVDTGCTLRIPKGTQVHFHGNSRLIVLKNGKLEVQGTKDEKVVFQGDRLEPIYSDEPGQWERIWLIESKGSVIEHAIIKNAVIGLQVDTLGDATTEAVTLKNTLIKDASSTGLLAQAGAWVKATNSVISDCGEYSAALTSGGRYEFTHCTIGNYWDHDDRSKPSFVLSNYYEDVNGNIIKRPIEQSSFINCIFYGDKDEEFVVDTESGPTLDFTFDHCLVKTEGAVTGTHFNSVWKNKGAGFEDPNSQDLHLISGAFPVDRGKTGTGVMVDYEENSRDVDPDLGAYELQ